MNIETAFKWTDRFRSSWTSDLMELKINLTNGHANSEIFYRTKLVFFVKMWSLVSRNAFSRATGLLLDDRPVAALIVPIRRIASGRVVSRRGFLAALGFWATRVVYWMNRCVVPF